MGPFYRLVPLAAGAQEHARSKGHRRRGDGGGFRAEGRACGRRTAGTHIKYMCFRRSSPTQAQLSTMSPLFKRLRLKIFCRSVCCVSHSVTHEHVSFRSETVTHCNLCITLKGSGLVLVPSGDPVDDRIRIWKPALLLVAVHVVVRYYHLDH